MSLELKVIEKNIGSLAINYDELKKELALQLEQFKGLVFGEEQITEAKQTRATLNKVKTVIDDRRKELKKEFLKPYEKVETQAKELVGMINDVNSEIDKQIKTFEEKEKEEKRNQIAEIWNNISGIEKRVDLEKVFDNRWLNKTYSLKQVEEDIYGILGDIEDDIQAIKLLCVNDPDKEKALKLCSKYLVTLDLKQVITQYNLEQEAKKKLVDGFADRKSQAPIIEKEAVEEENATEEELEEEDLYELCFKVVGTKNQIIGLEKFMRETKLKYKHIEIEKESE